MGTVSWICIQCRRAKATKLVVFPATSQYGKAKEFKVCNRCASDANGATVTSL